MTHDPTTLTLERAATRRDGPSRSDGPMTERWAAL